MTEVRHMQSGSFGRYCDELRSGDDALLRENFVKKMNFICRVEHYDK